jgi:Annexin.
VCRIIGCSDKGDIARIAAAYERKYGEPLHVAIKRECSGNYKRCAIAWVTMPDVLETLPEEPPTPPPEQEEEEEKPEPPKEEAPPPEAEEEEEEDEPLPDVMPVYTPPVPAFVPNQPVPHPHPC